MTHRSAWTRLSDPQLLAQCEVDTYRASGPGGQKRNKTSSAVRLRHLPSGLRVIAEESRSQHENKARALKRLRQTLFLTIRENPTDNTLILEDLEGRPEFASLLDPRGKLDVGRKDPAFWPAMGLILDTLQAMEGRVSDAAARLGITTGNLMNCLQLEPKVWESAARIRNRFGLKPLRAGA